MEKFNFKNYDRKNRNYGNNDLNIDRLSRELIDTPRRSTNHGHRGMQNQAPRVGLTDQTLIKIRNFGLEKALEFVASHDVVDMNCLKEADGGMTIKFIYRKSK
ncbi:MAG: hypothetical protein SPI42_06615 [Lactobacillus johnsonii]|nr:hypothetical protein [Lactobacillus johnsonii]MDY6195799.1 hypothetical protein [Lactobacillus johnsonii]